uniref:Uncharacterized protein n=1 Tax=Romanomermis culicivorax TaxID=13658 RepID=A0A915L2I8_ROMCU
MGVIWQSGCFAGQTWLKTLPGTNFYAFLASASVPAFQTPKSVTPVTHFYTTDALLEVDKIRIQNEEGQTKHGTKHEYEISKTEKNRQEEPKGKMEG